MAGYRFISPADSVAQGYEMGQRLRSDGANMRAGAALRAGNVRGAAGELYGAGNLDGGQELERRQAMQERQAATDAASQQKTQEEASTAQRERMMEAFTTMGRLTADIDGPEALEARKRDPQFRQVFDTIGRDLGQGASTDTLTFEDIQGIQRIAGSMAEPKKPLVVGGSVLDPDTYQPIYEQPQKPMIVGQGATVLGADGKPIYTNPKTFAPQRARARGPAATVPALPPGFVMEK